TTFLSIVAMVLTKLLYIFVFPSTGVGGDLFIPAEISSKKLIQTCIMWLEVLNQVLTHLCIHLRWFFLVLIAAFSGFPVLFELFVAIDICAIYTEEVEGLFENTRGILIQVLAFEDQELLFGVVI